MQDGDHAQFADIAYPFRQYPAFARRLMREIVEMGIKAVTRPLGPICAVSVRHPVLSLSAALRPLQANKPKWILPSLKSTLRMSLVSPARFGYSRWFSDTAISFGAAYTIEQKC